MHPLLPSPVGHDRASDELDGSPSSTHQPLHEHSRTDKAVWQSSWQTWAQMMHAYMRELLGYNAIRRNLLETVELLSRADRQAC